MQLKQQAGAPARHAGYFQDTLRFCQRVIFDSSELVFLLGILLLSVILNGIWLSPAAIRMFRFSQNPFTNPFRDSSDWLLENYLLPWLAHAFGANGSILTYAAFCLALLVLGLLCVYWLAHRHAGRILARSLAVVWLVSPTSLIVMGSIGYVDTITVLVASVLALKRNSFVLTIPLSFAMGLNHWTQGVVILCLVTAAELAACPAGRIRRLAWFGANLVALAAGLGLLRLVFATHGIDPGTDRLDYVASRGFDFFFRIGAKSFGLLLYATFGVLWLFLYRVSKLSEFPGKGMIGALFLAALGISLITPDHTRVFAMLSWPVIVIMVDRVGRTEFSGSRFQPIRLRSMISLVAFVGLLVPKVAVWLGEPYGSLIYHDVLVIIDAVNDPDSLRWTDNNWVVNAFNR